MSAEEVNANAATERNATMRQTRTLGALAALALLAAAAETSAHHAIVAEYGGSSQPLVKLEGEVTKVRWRAPHVEVYVRVSGGDLPVGEEWVVNSHAPGLLARTYGIQPGEVSAGDKVRFVGWKTRFNVPRYHMRALSINGGPMRSTLRGADNRDIRDGTLGEILPAPGLNSGTPLDPGEL